MIDKYREDTSKKKIFVFILIEVTIYFVFLYLDIFQQNIYEFTNQLKYFSIILCFLFALSYTNKQYKIDRNIVSFGLFFTLCADWFLLLHDDYIIGVIFFLVVQMIYMLRIGVLYRKQDRTKLYNKIILKFGCNIICSILICVIIYMLGIQIDFFLFITLLYFVCIVHNTISSIKLAIHDQSQLKYSVFAIGMVLFLLCDINVGIYNLNDFLDFDNMIFNTIYRFSVIGMWLFYLPSQVCISLSFYSN